MLSANIIKSKFKDTIHILLFIAMLFQTQLDHVVDQDSWHY